MQDLSIRKILEKIGNGSIRVPSFQRGFVWDPEAIAFFMDSLYKKYPIGAVLLWRTHERLSSERKLGRFELPEPEKDYPVDYVLDGQQRLTSIFSVFQKKLKPQDDPDWLDIYYVIGGNLSQQQSCFIPLSEDQVDCTKHFPLNVLFEPIEYRKATTHLSESVIREIDQLQASFQEIAIPTQLMETDDKGHVAIVFERINRSGVPLDSFQLLTAWSWSTEFDLKEKLEELSEELQEYNFEGLIENQGLLMKCFTGYILGNTSPSAIMNLDGANLRDNFDAIKNGIKSSIDFLKKELHLYSLNYLPYSAILVTLTRFFGSSKLNGKIYTDKQRIELIRWFWRSCFSRRYSSGVNDAHSADIAAISKLVDDEDFSISNFKCEINCDFFTKNVFNINSVNTRTFIAMLASKHPKSFISGASVDLSKTLKKCNSKEFHHIFPICYLKSIGINERSEVFKLANFCFLNNSDNQKIKDKSPEEYVKLMNKKSLNKILDSSICPRNTFILDYNNFIKERTNLLTNYANELIR